MDLALHLGRTLQELKRDMSEMEFEKWYRYSGKYMLPQRRLELYLANIAMTVAQSGGATDLHLEDFLFDPVAPPMTAQQAFENDARLLGFAPTKD